MIREAGLEDTENIAVLKQQVWISTYAVEGIRAEFSNYVLAEFTPGKIRDTILDKNKKSFVALIENHLAGYVEIDLHPKAPLAIIKDQPEIAVLYVLERFCGQGIGSSLLITALSDMKEAGASSVWLTVYINNDKAIRFYTGKHFREIGRTCFVIKNKYENLIMKADL